MKTSEKHFGLVVGP